MSVMSEFLSNIDVFQRIFKVIGISPVDISEQSQRTSSVFTGYNSIIILLSSLLLYYSAVTPTSIYSDSEYIAQLLDNANLWATLSLHIYVQFESWRKHNVLIDITKQFNEIDNELIKNFQVKFNRASMRRNILKLGLIYSYTFSTVVFLTMFHVYLD